VSWTAGAVPSRYYVYLYLNDSSVTNTYTSLGETKASFNWTSQTEGEYTARVTAYIPGSSPYFKNSDYAASAKQKYEALFDSSSGYPYASGPQPITTNGTLTGFSVQISFNNSAKPSVTYAVERTPVDAAGNAGTYAAVSTLYASATGTTALTAADLTADVLGLLKYSSVYDKSLPATAGKYKYRVKATKGTVTQTKEISSTVTVDPRNYTYVSSISIGAATGTNPKTYAVTPSVSYKDALQTGDKLVIYYAKGAYGVYQTGPYTKGIEFSKDELEAATAKELKIPKIASDNYAYMKAYLEFADGSCELVSGYSISGGGLDSTNDSNNSYTTLDY
jgi:hypothetical protein